MTAILLILALPLLFAVGTLSPFAQRLSNLINPGWILGALMAASFAALLGVAYDPVIAEQGAATYTLSWVPEYNLDLTFYLDSLALMFGLIITGIGAVVFLYAGYYFDDPDERLRFLRYMLLFSAAMLWVVLSGNLITLFIAWELTSITSFLLIGFKGDKYESARQGAMRALVVTGAGGLALLGGVLMLGAAAGTYQMDELLTMNLTDHSWYVPIMILIMLGAFTKSAQFPFHFWLPGAMDAPTPASSFLHSATMVKAGVYLLARLYPVLGGSDLWENALMGVGLLTLLMGSVLAIRQPDLKGLLAYTTIAKLGALVAMLGVPDGYGIKAALVGIMAHALYKSALFLSVGSIDHAVGTRLVSKLGALWKEMPITGGVVIVSAISMAGVPPMLGFVAKETMLEAFYDYPVLLAIVFISALFTAAAGYILIWDVFFGKRKSELHFHKLPLPLEGGTTLLAAGTILFAFTLSPLVKPLITPLIPVSFKLVLFPGFITVFWISIAAVLAGFVIFAVRDLWRNVPSLGVLAVDVYDRVIGGLEWTADQVLKTQNGKLRHYLIVILSVVMTIVLYNGLVNDLIDLEDVSFGTFTIPDVLDVMLLILAVSAAFISVTVERHLYAALALAIFGYAIGGVFLVEPAPDVALVQLLVETLATVVLVIMIGRVSLQQRQEAMDALKRPLTNWRDSLANFRDIAIAVITGLVMFGFSLVALVNRDNRDSIAAWHLDNAYPEVGVTDVVSAILTDFRGTDTLIEIGVFGIAALGLFALLTINRRDEDELPPTVTEKLEKDSRIATPMLRIVAAIVMPITLVIAAVHILYGANAPGDGFTAGVVAGLGVALYYVVFGYEKVRQRLTWLRPLPMLITGLALALVNATLPILFTKDGAFMGLIDFAPNIDFANLKFTTTIVFELAIAQTVFGAVSLIMETIAHPADVRAFERRRTQSMQAVEPPATPTTDAEQQYASGD